MALPPWTGGDGCDDGEAEPEAVVRTAFVEPLERLVAAFVIVGERAVALMKRTQDDLARHQPKVAQYTLLMLSAFLLFDALTLL